MADLDKSLSEVENARAVFSVNLDGRMWRDVTLKFVELSVAQMHRAKSHFQPDGVIPFGNDRRAARELRRMYEDFKNILTDEEKRIVVRYESRL